MTIAYPAAWGLLLLAVPIILLFFLKVRFRTERVTTMIFWQQVLEERRTRKLHPQFRFFLSLILALLFLTILTAAALNPTRSNAPGNRLVLIIDNSASMKALLPDGRSQLDIAKRQAARLLGQLAADQHVAIISSSVEPQIISGFTNHFRMLRRKLAAISGTDFPGDLAAAQHLAEQLIADTPDAPIYVYTAGGPPVNNLAITRFQPRRLPGHVADYEIFIEVVNFGTETVHTRLEIDCDGTPVDVVPLSLEPDMPVTKIIRNTSSRGGLLQATLTETDSLATDNTAVAFLSEQFIQRILLYGEENFFLRHVLQVQPQTEMVLIQEIPESIPPDSVLVLHRTVPPTLPPGNVMIIDPQHDSNLFQLAERLEHPMVSKVDSQSPLVRFIAPGLFMPGAKRILPQTSPSHTLLATAEEFPLYLQFVWDNQRVLILSADLNRGDFTLQTAFPILISQALAYFRNSDELQKAYSTAEPVQLTVQTEPFQVILRSPSGREDVYPCRSGSVSLGRLGECGVWTVLEQESGQELARFACNLFNATESNLHTEPTTHKEPGTERSAVPGPLWHYLILLALLLTVTEWFLYQRRWIE